MPIYVDLMVLSRYRVTPEKFERYSDRENVKEEFTEKRFVIGKK